MIALIVFIVLVLVLIAYAYVEISTAKRKARKDKSVLKLKEKCWRGAWIYFCFMLFSIAIAAIVYFFSTSQPSNIYKIESSLVFALVFLVFCIVNFVMANMYDKAYSKRYAAAYAVGAYGFFENYESGSLAGKFRYSGLFHSVDPAIQPLFVVLYGKFDKNLKPFVKIAGKDPHGIKGDESPMVELVDSEDVFEFCPDEDGGLVKGDLIVGDFKISVVCKSLHPMKKGVKEKVWIGNSFPCAGDVLVVTNPYD